ncbi:MAG: hypothetical protein NVSMB9_17650 [Isosphaeraceae bacterium]
MRGLARIGYVLVAVGLVAPTFAQAGPRDGGPRKAARRSLLSKSKDGRLCPACQRQKLISSGVRNVPLPPSLPQGRPVPGETCSKCGDVAAVIAGPISPNSPRMANNAPPGHAVVGGPQPQFLADGMGPVPIGLSQTRLAASAPSGVPGARDTSVMQTSMGTDPVSPKEHRNPRVVSHLLGFSSIGRDRSESRQRRKLEKHASIPYGYQPQAVHDLPASAVFGR